MANNKTNSYHEKIKIEYIQKLRELSNNLPSFCNTFFRGIQEKSSVRTLVGYAYDLQIFFKFLKDEKLTNITSIRDIKISDLESLNKVDIEDYLDYLGYYISDDNIVHTNDARGKARKLSALKGLYNYLCESELITNNPVAIVHSPKIHEKNIIKLDPNEVAKLLDVVEFGFENESKHQMAYHNQTKIRDLALLTLLLGTGIRVSECVGLNISDIDFDNCAIKIIRKGGNESTVYFGEEVEDALYSYLQKRKKIIVENASEDALFLSMQKKRISVRAVENLVKKYASKVTSLKKITPHKLRSTYGTNLYKESGDIYLVASVLGHKDVNTTKKHYASMDEDAKRKAARIVKLRKE